MDPSSFMTPEGLPPPQPINLYGKENKGAGRLATNLPSVASKNKALAPIGMFSHAPQQKVWAVPNHIFPQLLSETSDCSIM
eukprot:scaffold657285_cov59-Prasinocladus_malaysianus.AAC.1